MFTNIEFANQPFAPTDLFSVRVQWIDQCPSMSFFTELPKAPLGTPEGGRPIEIGDLIYAFGPYSIWREANLANTWVRLGDEDNLFVAKELTPIPWVDQALPPGEWEEQTTIPILHRQCVGNK